MLSNEIAKEWLDLCYEQWLHACGNTSQLRDSTLNIVSQMKAAVMNNETGEASYYMTRLRDLGDRFSLTPTGALKNHAYELAETLVECGRAAYLLDDKLSAMQYFEEAAGKYTGHDHFKAVALWMLGCLQWQRPTRVNDAILSWEQGYELFRGLQIRANRPGYAEWYRYWQRVMRNTLDHAVLESYVSPPSEDEWPNPAGVDAKKESDKVSRNYVGNSVLSILPVYADVPAGGFEHPHKVEETVQTGEVVINASRYSVMSLHSESQVRLKPAEQYAVVRVKGDSMNRAGIENGDYVLLHVHEKPGNNDIVIAELTDPQMDDGCTLKRYKEQDGLHILMPDSRNPAYKPMEFTKFDPGFTIHGVVICVFKKIRS